MCATLLEDAETYNPDTLDLNKDTEAADYWFSIIDEIINKFAIQAIDSQKEIDPTSAERAERFKKSYKDQVQNMRNSRNNNKPLTIRNLLELNETTLRLHGFEDPWLKQKTEENEASIKLFKSRLDEIDKLNDDDKWTELIRGVLAGNIFDWGAKEVSDILEKNKNFGLHDALDKIQKRPWLIDNLNEWILRMQETPHKCAVIFVDNSGADVILGILPFARELLKRQTKILLCANSEPALNDVTFKELEDILQKCSFYCDTINSAMKNGQLLVYANGQTGPCLDMRRLTPELCNAIESNETDLLVIEGMGRALHTNLYAKFRCDTLKLAVVKNKWLANRLGGDTFSVICKYES